MLSHLADAKMSPPSNRTCEVAFDGKQGVDAIVRSFQEGQKRFNCVLVRPIRASPPPAARD